jgi:DNA-directed RNA polymerase subunit RPC12/RpoP
MNTPSETADAIQEQANHLYWHSDETVEQLADRLGMSRNALYSAVRPVPVGVTCVECGDPLMFANRSSRAAGKAACETCGFETLMSETETEAAETRVRSGAEPRETEPQDRTGRFGQWKEDLSTIQPERAALIGGAAVLGVALGAVAVKAVRAKL